MNLLCENHCPAILLHELNNLYECADPSGLPEVVQHILSKTVPCDFTGWYDISEDGRIRGYDQYMEALGEDIPGFNEQLQELFALHPFTRHYMKGGAEEVLRLSDFEMPADWLEHPLFGPLASICRSRTNFMLGARLVRPGDGFIALSIGRVYPDYTDDETGMIRETIRHISRHAVSVGLIRPEPDVSSNQPEPAYPATLSSNYGLTPRETDVVIWAARGKCNQAIATILGISPHTVRTHLQNIFEKMGVENRASLSHAVWTMG